MRNGALVGVVIPALNEVEAIGRVIADIPAWVDKIVIADNGSTDGTDRAASAAGATVVVEPEKGYGAACLAGIAALGTVDIVVFVDGDYSDHPGDMADLVDPIVSGTVDFTIASRVIGAREAGSLTPQQMFGNWLATRLIAGIWRQKYTDLGPFRGIRKSSLDKLAMADRNFGWTVEMQIKAAQQKLRVLEVPGRYRRRIGVSKVSGTLKGTIMAGYTILYVIGRHALRRGSQ